jgi:hypothetical protein
VIVRGGQDRGRDVPDMRLPDLRLGADAVRLQAGHDGVHRVLAFAVGAVHPDAAIPADRVLVHVQDYDVVATVPAQLAGQCRLVR